MRADGRGRPWWGPAIGATGAGLVSAAALTPELLARGGLAVLAVATVAACFLGAPLARADWERAPGHPTASPLADDLADGAAIGSVGAALAGVLPAGAYGWILFAGAWALALLMGRVRWLAGLAVLGVVGWMGLAGALGAGAAPWGLLEPAAHTWGSWIGTAVALGVLAAQAPGWWTRAAPPAPGRSGGVRLAGGLALLALLGASVALASEAERTLGLPSTGVDLARAVSAALAGGALLARGGLGAPAGERAVMGALATGWFALTGAGAPAFWFAVTLPAALAVSCGLRAVRGRDALQGAGAATLGAAALASIPEVPGQVLAAGALAVPAVVAVWIAGTRSLARSPA